MLTDPLSVERRAWYKEEQRVYIEREENVHHIHQLERDREEMEKILGENLGIDSPQESKTDHRKLIKLLPPEPEPEEEDGEAGDTDDCADDDTSEQLDGLLLLTENGSTATQTDTLDSHSTTKSPLSKPSTAKSNMNNNALVLLPAVNDDIRKDSGSMSGFEQSVVVRSPANSRTSTPYQTRETTDQFQEQQQQQQLQLQLQIRQEESGMQNQQEKDEEGKIKQNSQNIAPPVPLYVPAERMTFAVSCKSIALHRGGLTVISTSTPTFTKASAVDEAMQRFGITWRTADSTT